MRRRSAVVSAVLILALAACSSDGTQTLPSGASALATTTSTASGPTSTDSVSTVTPATVPPSTAAPTTVEPTTVEPTTAPATTTTVASTTITTTSTTTSPPTAPAATSTPYGMPVADAARASYAHEHHDYPASDVFVRCGASIVAPVNGTVLEARRTDDWVAGIDDPATRGGKSVSILGDDGVRYYLAHMDSILDGIEPGVRITIGQPLGLMGRTGKAGACHVHVAISPPCPGKEWAVRRGVIWPWPYLDAWRTGEQLSPVAEIEQWSADHPTACADAMADPTAANS